MFYAAEGRLSSVPSSQYIFYRQIIVLAQVRLVSTLAHSVILLYAYLVSLEQHLGATRSYNGIVPTDLALP